MIDSAEEFVRLRTSEDPAEYNRAAQDDATESTWHDVIERFPDMRFWVAQNKTVPLSVPRGRARPCRTARAKPDGSSSMSILRTATPKSRSAVWPPPKGITWRELTGLSGARSLDP